VDIFYRILHAGKFIPPKKVRESLLKHFPHAKSAEWVRNHNDFEAIFYENSFEKIAHFSKDGSLREYRINLRPEALASVLPENILRQASSEGEIMNCISVHNGDNLLYEFIVRDKALTRYLLVITSEGEKTGPLKL
jgi:hypothetical protein